MKNYIRLFAITLIYVLAQAGAACVDTEVPDTGTSAVDVDEEAASFTGSWDQIGQRKVLDALACSVQALQRTDKPHSCAEVAPSAPGHSTAECSFTMNLTGNRAVWRLDGTYDAKGTFTGLIVQTTPSCSGFLCGALGTVRWYGRGTQLPQQYLYSWVGSGLGAHCDVMKLPGSGQVAGDFYGSY